jgi:hypothetical protein
MVHKKSAKTPGNIHKYTHTRSGFTGMFPIVVAVLVLILVGLGTYTFKDSVSLWWNTTIRPQIVRRTPQPTPTPRPIAHGKQSFNASGGTTVGPRFMGGSLDPYDPAKGTKQTISIQVSSATPVTSIYGKMISDHAQTTVQLTRVSGTDYNGTWQGIWTATDTYLYNYGLGIYASNINGTNKIEMTLR